ncbi:unnamed protein product [Haemonchus placei]|uniref:Tetratricopeptide repeat protein n=1 Tax=Haemonchus placei TaxID=6290 RepID=A0A0N4VZY4_HAEPC|nr:unnamed protein product [Haemonchus placei]
MALGELIKRMLHANDWQSIVDLNYGKLEDEVERTLLTSARAQEATVPHHLFKLVFSFYMKRNDFEGAARAQYEYAFVLRTQAEQTPELLRKRRDALAVASTLLDLLPENDRFISFPSEVFDFSISIPFEYVLHFSCNYVNLNRQNSNLVWATSI